MFSTGHLGGFAENETRRRDARDRFQFHGRLARWPVLAVSDAGDLDAAYADLLANRLIGETTGAHPLFKYGHDQ